MVHLARDHSPLLPISVQLFAPLLGLASAGALPASWLEALLRRVFCVVRRLRVVHAVLCCSCELLLSLHPTVSKVPRGLVRLDANLLACMRQSDE